MFKEIFNIILESRLQDYVIQLKDQDLARNIFAINDPKKQRMIIKYIRNGSIQYPKDIDIIDKAYQIINRKNLDYNNYNNLQEILDQYKDLNQKLDYNPDNESCFINKIQLGNGVVVYNVLDNYLGLKAVRKAVDYNWGEDSNPWCLITPPMDRALTYWKRYNAIQKRICFQNNKLIALCANEEYKIQWWDRNNKATQNIPIEGVLDDPNVVQEIQLLNIGHITATPQKLKQIYQKYKNNQKIKQKIAQNHNTPLQILWQLSNEDLDIKQLILDNSNCSEQLYNKLLKEIKQINVIIKKCKNSKDRNELQQMYQNYNKFKQINWAIAENQYTPLQILQKLSQSENNEIIFSLTKNPNCPSDILQKASNNLNNNFIRQKVAQHKNTSINILQKLSNDHNQFVRSYVAQNPNTPIEILQKLSENYYEIVRQGVIKNPNCPKELLQKLCNDRDTTTRNMAKRYLKKRFN